MTVLTNTQRTVAVGHAQFLIDWKASIGYGDSRPVPWINESMNGLRKRFQAKEIWEPDCSGSVEWICKWAGWKSPTGLAWGLGGSKNMWEHLSHYTNPAHAKAGALVTYGDDGGIHVCMVMQPDGANPWLFSHGSAAGPLHIRLDDENAAHRGQTVTFLDVSGPIGSDPVPTRLRPDVEALKLERDAYLELDGKLYEVVTFDRTGPSSGLLWVVDSRSGHELGLRSAEVQRATLVKAAPKRAAA